MYKFDTISTNELSLRKASLRDASHALLAIRKSPDPDGISSDLLKYTSTAIIPYLIKLFNEVFLTGIVPDSWGESIIVPIH